MSSDDLAHTATEPTPAGPGKTKHGPGGTIGRYRIERELGAGGMGVVYAAVDPDLERRVAVKVLKSDSNVGRERLLREARAMARLDHPNVVDVYEVGSVDGVDYVAMELVDGGSLQDWLREAKRTPKEIVHAFLLAGRGLAAAHAAGLVHRDFKPHNVLRARDGRICVTDFGLARDANDADDAPLDSKALTARMLARTPLSGLTNTGAMIGTPAYMAPEQWRGERAGPAADQFAFTVALWEALHGERPYPGKTAVELAEQTEAGPNTLRRTVAKWLHAALCRGLHPDPKKRYPSMDALLRRVNPPRLPWLVITAVLFAAVVAGTAYAVYDAELPAVAGHLPSPCTYSAQAPEFTDAELAQLAPELRQRVEADLSSWRIERGYTCGVASPRRAQAFECFEASTARLTLVVRAGAGVRTPAAVERAIGLLITPSACVQSRGHFAFPTSDAMVAAMKAYLVGDPAPAGAVAGTTCARALANPSDLMSAQACGDDALLAQRSLDAMHSHPEDDGSCQTALEAANVLVQRIPSPALMGQLQMYDAEVSDKRGHFEDGRLAQSRAIANFAKCGMVAHARDAAMAEIHAYLDRARPEDLGIARLLVATWRPAAKDRARELDRADALARFAQGDVAGAHAELAAAWTEGDGAVVVTGEVRDGGAPVAGAIVAAAPTVMADAIGPIPYDVDDKLRIATTDANGRFELRLASADAVIVAQSKDRRSVPIAVTEGKAMTLSLASTRRVTGSVKLGTSPSTQATAFAGEARFKVIAPVAADGTFVLAGVPVGDVAIGATIAGRATSVTQTSK